MRIFYVQNKHTILIYSLEPPTTTKIGGFFFTQRKQWEAQVKKILLVAGMLCCPIVAHAAINDGSITGCAFLECPDGYVANLITCECAHGLGSDCTIECADCTAWTTVDTASNVQMRTCYSLDTESCVCMPDIRYRCQIGYYGTPDDTDMTCTECPENGLTTVSGDLISGIYDNK